MKIGLRLTSFVVSVILFSSPFAKADDPTPVPPEHLLAQIPDLGPTGDIRVSWAIVRPPMLWIQDQVFDLRKFPLAHWETAQIPITIAPPTNGNAWVVIENEAGKIIDTIELKKPFVPDAYVESKGEVPARVRIRSSDLKRRVIFESKPHPWISRKEVFQCSIELDESTPIETDRRVKSCLSTIKGLAAERERQWFAKIAWPESRKPESKGFVSQWDRELRSEFRKANHAYESDRKPKRIFNASVGITRVEEVQKFEIDSTLVSRADVVALSPPRETARAILHEQLMNDGSKLTIHAFANDSVETRAKGVSRDFAVPIDLQFVATSAREPSIRSTEFKEIRTGLPSLFRSWRGSVFATANRITSGRGESAQLGNGPGIELGYKPFAWELKPYFAIETGLVHPGSTLFITDIRAGASRGFNGWPEWLSAGAGYHQFQLAGQNPGSTRLGKIDAIDLGFFGFQRAENSFIRGEALLMVATATGIHAKLEFGYIHRTKWDIPFTSSAFVGYSRFAAETLNRVQVAETFTEDRVFFGFSFGFLGPDSDR